jgi:ribosomal protein L40E
MEPACTLSALASLDQTDPDAVQALLQACTAALFDPSLWWWALGITLFCAVVGALIGKAKGRWLAGLLWGAALGPVGWLVVALSRSGFVECVECGRPNAPAAKVCRHCGVDLRKAAAQSERSRLKRDDWASRRRD